MARRHHSTKAQNPERPPIPRLIHQNKNRNTYIQLLQLDSPLQATHYPKYQYNLWLTNQARYKKELHYLGKTIICHLLQIKTENWNEAISKLATVNIKTAPREFYSTMKKLGGMGRGSNHVTKMEYKNTDFMFLYTCPIQGWLAWRRIGLPRKMTLNKWF